MRLGLITNVLAANGLRELADIASWAATNGFEEIEAGPSIPLDSAAFHAVAQHSGVSVSAFIYCRNFLGADRERASFHVGQLLDRIRFAGDHGIPTVVTTTGIDRTVDPDDDVYDLPDIIRRPPAKSLGRFEEVFTPIVELAESRGVRIAFETCPLMGNISLSPAMWDGIFSRIDSPSLGVTFDPSHMVWQMIDPYLALREYGHRVLHVHAKDCVIDRERLARTGIITNFDWWRYTIPGDGELDWQRIASLLRDAGYEGSVSVEHEDAAYESDLDAVKRGLVLSRECLAPLFT